MGVLTPIVIIVLAGCAAGAHRLFRRKKHAWSYAVWSLVPLGLSAALMFIWHVAPSEQCPRGCLIALWSVGGLLLAVALLLYCDSDESEHAAHAQR